MTQGAVSRSQRNAARNVSVRHRPKGVLATRRSPLAHRPWGARHVGFRPGLVDEDRPPRIDRRLTRLPPLTPPGDVRPVRRLRRLFFERHAFMLEKTPKPMSR